jgi:uncharacterized membrane protein YczE
MKNWKVESIFSLCIVIGTFLMTFNSDKLDIIAFSLFIFGNIVGMYITIKNKMFIMLTQYVILSIFCTIGLINRL